MSMGAAVRRRGDGRWAMGDGRWAMGDGRWAMGDGRWTMGGGRWLIRNEALMGSLSSTAAPHQRFVPNPVHRPPSIAHRPPSTTLWNLAPRRTVRYLVSVSHSAAYQMYAPEVVIVPVVFAIPAMVVVVRMAFKHKE